jgi:cytochrome c oxidase cbb3-type subunit 2
LISLFLMSVFFIAALSCATNAPNTVAAEQGSPNLNDPAIIARGTHLYMQYCQACHGETGQGDGPAASALPIPPRDLTSEMFKFRSTPISVLPTAADLHRTIAQGIPGTPMPAWDSRLDERDMWALVAYLQTMIARNDPSKSWPEPEDILQIPNPPEMTTASVAAGEKLFTQFGCAACHGTKGLGDGPAAGALTDYKGRPIAVPDFSEGKYKSGPEGEDLYRSIATGLAGTPMPGFGDSLEPTQIWQIVRYIQSRKQDSGVVDYILSPEPGRL